MNYYRKPIEKTINDVKLKMQIGALAVKITENINKINDLLEVDKNIKKDVGDNSNSIKNMKNETDLKLSDKVDQKYINDTLYDKKYIDNLLSDNYYDKTNINLKFGDLYNKTYIDYKLDNIYDKNNINLKFNDLYNKNYLDNKFDNIYDKTEINDKNSKLNRNIVLFNTNLTNHIDKYSNENNIDEDIKENKDNLNNFIINTFSNFSTNISNLNNTQNKRLKLLEENKITDVQKNKINSLENIDLGKINASYNHSIFNKHRVDKIRYYIKEFILFNITLIKKFTFIGNINELMLLQFELDQREFSVGDILDYNINVNFQYDNSKSNWYRLKMRFDILYDDESLISSFTEMLVSKGFLYYHLINFNINKFIKINKITSKIIFKIYLVKNNTSLQDNIVVTMTNNYESNYCDIIHYTIL